MSCRWEVDPTLLDPEFAADVHALLDPSPYAWSVYYGFRTYEEQATLYAKYQAGGPLAAPPGESAHEHGLAVDVAIVDPHSGVDTWAYNTPPWPWLWGAVKASPRLHSGHDFPPVAPADDDHIQAVKWWALEAQLKASGQWGKPNA